MIEKVGFTDPMFDRYQNDATAIHLLRSQWWYRAWTLQEILLASRATIVIGRYSIDWDHLRIGVNHGLGLGIWTPIAMGIMRDPILGNCNQADKPSKVVSDLARDLVLLHHRV